MGVCPQHDILWDQLTGKEHIELFARIKGAAGTAVNVEQEVSERLRDVLLEKDGEARAGAPSATASSSTEDVRTDEMFGDRIEARTAPSWIVVSSTVTVGMAINGSARSQRRGRPSD